MTIPGQPPVQIVCCDTCTTAIAVGDPRRVVDGERSEQLKAAIKPADRVHETHTAVPTAVARAEHRPRPCGSPV